MCTTNEVHSMRKVVMFLAVLNILCCVAVIVMFRQQRISHDNLQKVIQADIVAQEKALEYALRSELMHQSLCHRQDELAAGLEGKKLKACPGMENHAHPRP